jgi:hypothetical protein
MLHWSSVVFLMMQEGAISTHGGAIWFLVASDGEAPAHSHIEKVHVILT